MARSFRSTPTSRAGGSRCSYGTREGETNSALPLSGSLQVSPARKTKYCPHRTSFLVLRICSENIGRTRMRRVWILCPFFTILFVICPHQRLHEALHLPIQEFSSLDQQTEATMQVPSPEPDLILPLLFICLVLVCILCTSCLILVIVVIRLTIHGQRSIPLEAKEKKDDAKGKVKEKVKEEVEKTIKKLTDPVQDLFHSAQDHLKHPKNPFTQQPISQYFHSDHSSANMSHIQNMVAVAQNDGNTILFQVNKNFEIIFYESRTPSERIPRKKYDMNTLKIKGKSIKVNPKLPIISAVAFTHPESCGGRAQVRVYYVDRDSLFLREIIRVGDKDEDWNDGMDFNDKDYTICEVSGLAANVFQSTGDKKSFQIKVYYQRDGADEFADVSYNVVGVTDEWSTRPNVTEA